MLVGALANFSIYWEFHHPNWRTHIFQRGRYTTNQLCDIHIISSGDFTKPRKDFSPATKEYFFFMGIQWNNMESLNIKGYTRWPPPTVVFLKGQSLTVSTTITFFWSPFGSVSWIVMMRVRMLPILVWHDNKSFYIYIYGVTYISNYTYIIILWLLYETIHIHSGKFIIWAHWHVVEGGLPILDLA